MTPFFLAWSNLTQQRIRTLISIVGVAFAVLLVFMQLGFMDSVSRTATLLYNKLDFDLILISSEYGNLARASTFSRRRIAQVRAVPGVARVLPLTTVLGMWTQPSDPAQPSTTPRPNWSILALAAPPRDLGEIFVDPYPNVFTTEEEFRDAVAQLGRLDTVVMDRTSTQQYGNAEIWKQQPYNELNGQQVQIVGTATVGTGFAYRGLLITSESTLSRVAGWPHDRVSFGLVKVAPDEDLQKVRLAIEAALPEQNSDVVVYTREELNRKEQRFWESGTSVGQFFSAGVVISLLVGGVFVYQMMAADISRRLPEYATIRAMGYPAGYLSIVVYWQGALLALLGFVPGLLASLVGYLFTEWFANVPIEMTLWRMGIVLALIVTTCMASAWVAVGAVHSADPADLF